MQKKCKMERPQKNSIKQEENEGSKVEKGVMAMRKSVTAVTSKTEKCHFGQKVVTNVTLFFSQSVAWSVSRP